MADLQANSYHLMNACAVRRKPLDLRKEVHVMGKAMPHIFKTALQIDPVNGSYSLKR